jgi:hypothetical protein
MTKLLRWIRFAIILKVLASSHAAHAAILQSDASVVGNPPHASSPGRIPGQLLGQVRRQVPGRQITSHIDILPTASEQRFASPRDQVSAAGMSTSVRDDDEIVDYASSYGDYGYHTTYADDWGTYYYDYFYDDSADDDAPGDDGTPADIIDNFDSFDNGLWYKLCAGCTFADGSLYVSGDSQMMRTYERIADLTRITGVLVKNR